MGINAMKETNGDDSSYMNTMGANKTKMNGGIGTMNITTSSDNRRDQPISFKRRAIKAKPGRPIAEYHANK